MTQQAAHINNNGDFIPSLSKPMFRSANMTSTPTTSTHPFASVPLETRDFSFSGPATHTTSIAEREPSTNENDAAVSMGWKDPVLTRVGRFYPISRTHRIFPKSDFNFILERLVSTFRRLSLHTSFYDAPSLLAICRSLEQVELAVNIWECHDEPDFIVLEIQRISGDNIIYYKYVKHIFSEILRKEVTTTDECSFERSSTARDKMGAIIESLPSPPDNIVQETLDIVSNMLLSDRRDARCLGLESLVILTDTSKTDISMATNVAKALLLGHCEMNGNIIFMDKSIQERIFHLVLMGRWPDSIAAAAGELRCDDGPHVHVALMAMANAINLLQTSCELSSVLDAASHVGDGGDNVLITAMESYVWNAHENPHAAYLATRILKLLYRAQPSSVHCGFQLDAVRAAHRIGHYRHAALEVETGQLLCALEI